MITSVLLAAAILDLHTVDVHGDGDFLTIQDAVNAAADGDTIIVHVPDDPLQFQSGFTVDGKSLVIDGVPGGPMPGSNYLDPRVIIGPVVVRGLSASETVVLRGLHFNRPSGTGSSPPFAPGLFIESCIGSVRVEECTVRGPAPGVIPALRASFAEDVTIVESIVVGSVSVAGDSGGAIVIEESRAAIFESTIDGRDGWDSHDYNGTVHGGDGGIGVALVGRSFAWIGGSTIRGGNGGHASCSGSNPCNTRGGDGGAGLSCSPSSVCITLEAEITGGEGGRGSFGTSNTDGADAPASIGSPFDVPGAQRRIEVDRAQRDGTPTPVRIVGTEGEVVSIQIADAGGLRYLGWQFGMYSLRPPLAAPTVELGPIPASGVLEAQIDLPSVDPSGARTFHIQATCRSAPNRFRQTAPAAITCYGVDAPNVLVGERVYVDAAAPAARRGKSWLDARSDLRAVLRAAPFDPSGETEIWIKAGRYTPAAAGGSPLQHFSLHSGLRIFGGFAGTETATSERDIRTNVTWIDGDLSGNDTPTGGRSDNARNLFLAGVGPDQQSWIDDVVLDGMTLSGAEGGAAIAFSGQLTLRNLTVKDNHAGIEGRAGGLDYGDVVIPDRALARLSIEDCVFGENDGYQAGAAYLQFDGTSGDPTGSTPAPLLTIQGSLFSGNLSLTNFISTGQIRPAGAVSIYDGFLNDQPLVQLHSNTFYENVCTARGSGALVRSPLYGDNGVLANNIFWQNRSLVQVGRADVAGFYFMTNTLRSNCYTKGPGAGMGLGDTEESPLFIGPRGPDGIGGTLDDDLRLGPGSPLIDRGATAFVPASLTHDLDGRPRIVDDPVAPNTGSGGPAIVDIGAYER